MVNRVNQEKQPRMQELQFLTDFELPQLLEVTHSGGRFLHFDSGPNDTKRILVFTTLLIVADVWFCDGTFSTAPSVFFSDIHHPRISRGNSDSHCVCLASRQEKRNIYSPFELLWHWVSQTDHDCFRNSGQKCVQLKIQKRKNTILLLPFEPKRLASQSVYWEYKQLQTRSRVPRACPNAAEYRFPSSKWCFYCFWNSSDMPWDNPPNLQLLWGQLRWSTHGGKWKSPKSQIRRWQLEVGIAISLNS